MRKILLTLQWLAFLIPFSFVSAKAQTYGNEWINFNQTYFKFKVAKSGIYRIPQNLLQSYGLGNIPGAQFMLFRDGQEVPLYVSASGALNTNDYIEFYGKMADGKMDQALYAPSTNQGNIDVNIISDSAAYFLTYSPTATPLRLTLQSNSLPSNLPTAEAFCTTRAFPNNTSIRDFYSEGESYYTGTGYAGQFHSGKYDKGEGPSYMGNPLTLQYVIENPYSTANPTFNTAVLLNSKLAAQYMKFYANNSLIFDTTVSTFALVSKSISFSQAYLTSNTAIKISVGSGFANALKAEIKYNRTFDFTTADKLDFNISGTNSLQRLDLLLNSANQNLLIDNSTSSIYHLGSSSTVLINQSAGLKDLNFSANPYSINSLNPVVFKDYNQLANQGTYIILSDNEYISLPNGGIEKYKNYRTSTEGGSNNVLVVSANELYNQFGYGMDYHPLSIRNFVRFAQTNANWTAKPESMFIIGKGISYNYVNYFLANRPSFSFSPIPTFGSPGSDILFTEIGNTNIPYMSVGRISAYNDAEIDDYLEKVKKYEAAQKIPSVPTLENSLWKKRGLHIAGAQDEALQSVFYGGLNACKAIIEDSLTGAIVTTAGKTTTGAVENATAEIDSLVASGVQYITFYGHASSSGFDYNLNTPESLTTTPRFPIFMAYGCNVAAIFQLTNTKTISENYLHVPNGGSIAMIANTNVGWTGFLDTYMTSIYRKIATDNYGKSIGLQQKEAIKAMTLAQPNDAFTQIHNQNLILQGDPGIKAYSPQKPDYYIDETLISVSPSILTTAMDSFTISATVYNLGEAVHQPISIKLTKTKAGSSTPLFTDTLTTELLNTGNISFHIPIDAIKDIGLFTYTLSLNDLENPDEITFANNKASVQVYISENNLNPIYPYNFSIVHNQGIELKASTLNAFLPLTRFLIEVDTSEYFTSAFKKTKQITSTGGIIKWALPFQMVDSTVYYWRTTIDTLINNKYYWNNSSFVYLQNGSEGWNQSHYFQYIKDDSLGLSIGEPSRKFKGLTYTKQLVGKIGVIGIHNDFNCYLNNEIFNWGSCIPNTNGILFALINPNTGLPVQNTGQYQGAYGPCGGRDFQFEFSIADSASRKKAMDFLNNVPNDYYIYCRSSTFSYLPGFTTAQEWMTDEAQYGTGNSLYHYLTNLGFSNVASIDTLLPFAGIAQKGNPTFASQFIVGATPNDVVVLTADLSLESPSGSLISTDIGPSAEWKTLRWKTNSGGDVDSTGDKVSVTVYGISSHDNAGGDSLFTTSNKDTTLATISASQYPYLRLIWNTQDSTRVTLPQLSYWRVLFQPLPEAALNPNLLFTHKDTLTQGENYELKLAIENLREIPMDSMLVRYRLIDANNTSHLLKEQRYKPLLGNDTLVASLSFNPTQYPGKNYIFIEANPNNDQPEQYHPNNLGYIPLFVNVDKYAPVLDVTFDGVHILNNDIISAKPFINILARDENKFALIADTSNFELFLTDKQSELEEKIPFDGTICKFIPATSQSGNNEARLEFKPTLKDGNYILSVRAKDKIGNFAGGNPSQKYEIGFEVVNASTITNVLNYPNPFSTSTQFVFTLTGSEIPAQFKIQIISVTGKVVKEITKAELGNLHIGRNITEYKWDGKDQFGQMLGNGVYLYRVITSDRNGEAIEKRLNSKVDKFFKKDYGKLYIMR